MKKRDEMDDDLRPEYDFATMKGGVRGKYFRRIREEGTNIVLLDPEVAEAFPLDASVNEAQHRESGSRSIHGEPVRIKGPDIADDRRSETMSLHR